MMALRILAILVIATILTGCGSASHKPPTTTDFSRDTTVQADFDSTWSNVVKWAALNNVPLDKVDKEDGLLSSQRGLAAGGVLDWSVAGCRWPTTGAAAISKGKLWRNPT